MGAAMKIVKAYKYDIESEYIKRGITEENGWVHAVNWEKFNKRKIIPNMALTVMVFGFMVLLFMMDPFVATFYDADVFWLFFVIFCVSFLNVVVVVPLHEILHFIPLVGFKLDDRCFIGFERWGGARMLYADPITRRQHLISLITPLVVLSLLFIAGIIFLTGLLQVGAVFSLGFHIMNCSTDIHVFFYYLKKFPKDTIFFGSRYRVSH